MLRQGSSGPAVSALQQQLKDRGFDPGPIDGQFGPRTAAAVRAFQAQQGIATDGIVGPITSGKLGQPAPAPTPAAPGPAAPQDPAAAAAQAATDQANANAAAAAQVQQQDAFARVQTVLGQYGVSGLSDWLWGEIKANNPESQIMLDLQNQPAFQARFPGMAALQKAGLPAITPAQYLATENSFRRNLAELGFDTKSLAPADFVPLFTSNIDPTEMKNRLDVFNTISTTFAPNMREDFLRHAGINLSDTDLYKMFHGLDPTLAMKYAVSTGTEVPSTSDFQKSLAGIPGISDAARQALGQGIVDTVKALSGQDLSALMAQPGSPGATAGQAPVTLSGLQQAEKQAQEDEAALFHSFSSAGAMDKAIDTAPAGTKNF
jgi:hypothetical protein